LVLFHKAKSGFPSFHDLIGESIAFNPENAFERKSWQACGQKKLDSSTFVGGKISEWG